jgi:hypothetical protein
MRVSQDGTGANGTWGTIRVVANETGHTLGNPSPVVDAAGSGRVFCHFARDNVDAFVSQSDDEGAHWTPPRLLDASVKYPGSSWYGSGVGGGIQLPASSLTRGSERIGPATARAAGQPTLMILAEERLGPAFNSVPITSTTGGAAWKRGPYLNDPHNTTHGLGEPSVALVPGAQMVEIHTAALFPDQRFCSPAEFPLSLVARTARRCCDAILGRPTRGQIASYNRDPADITRSVWL